MPAARYIRRGSLDFVFMVENIAQMYITGPKVVKSVTGSNITAEELGGFKVHNRGKRRIPFLLSG